MPYPDEIDAQPTFTDGTSKDDTNPTAVLTAAEITQIASSVTRTQNELGLNPSGSEATVAARLAAIEDGGVL